MANTVASARGVFEDKRSKKTGKTGARKLKSAPSHPPTQQMVDTAITTLKERGGSSLLAIKKYITAAYKVDVQKLAPFIKKYLKGAVVTGKLVQTKGNGATGSFKLSASASKELKAKSVYKKKLPKTKSAEAAQKIVKKGVTGGGKVTKISTTTKVKIIKKTATSDIKLKEIATATKKKVEKSKLKNIKETAIVKAEPVKPISVASKRKVPVTKMVSASKPKKAIATKKVNKQ